MHALSYEYIYIFQYHQKLSSLKPLYTQIFEVSAIKLHFYLHLRDLVISDQIFDEQSVTMDVFEDICKPIVISALEGIHGRLHSDSKIENFSFTI